MAQTEARAASVPQYSLSREVEKRFDLAGITSDQSQPFVERFDQLLQWILKEPDLEKVKGIGLVAEHKDQHHPMTSVRTGGLIMNPVAYWDLPVSACDSNEINKSGDPATVKLDQEWEQFGRYLYRQGVRLVGVGAWIWGMSNEEFPSLDDLSKVLRTEEGRNRVLMATTAVSQFWGLVSTEQLRGEDVTYQKLQQMVEPHQLLTKVRTLRGGEPVEETDLEIALREIATYHVSMQSQASYLGSSVGYDKSGLCLHDQLQVGDDKDQERIHTDCRPFVQDLFTRTTPLTIDVALSNSWVSRGKEAQFGPVVFEDFFLGPQTYIGDLIPQRAAP